MMGQLSPILRGGEGFVTFWCPGCKDAHRIPFGPGDGPRWGYNGNPNAPTFTPSILVRTGHYVPGRGPGTCYCTWDDKDEFPELECSVCHSFVTDGRIQFLGDSTHELAGQTVDLPNWPEPLLTATDG